MWTLSGRNAGIPWMLHGSSHCSNHARHAERCVGLVYRWDMSQRMYADNAELVHSLFMVRGKKNIFGAHNFWDVLNRRIEAKVKRLGELMLGAKHALAAHLGKTTATHSCS